MEQFLLCAEAGARLRVRVLDAVAQTAAGQDVRVRADLLAT